MSVEIHDNSKEVSEDIKAALLRGLETCGLVAEGYAKKLAPVDTGNLRNSITHDVDDVALTVTENAVDLALNDTELEFVDNKLGIKNVNVNKLTKTESDELILFGGNA